MSAKMFPKLLDEFDGPYSEEMVYEALSKLSDDYVVFHSVHWLQKRRYRNFIHHENDFIVMHRKLGIFMLEVKGGHIYFEDNVFHQINTETNEDNEIKNHSDPLNQALDGVYELRRKIDKLIPGITKRLSVEPLIWFPSCIKSPKNKFGLEYQDYYDVILDANNFKNLGKELFDIFTNFYHADTTTNITDEEFNRIVSLIANEVDLILAPSMLKGKIESEFIKLTNEQYCLLDYISEQTNATIQGAAGTGKTVIAVEAAKRFARDGRKVLFLCFNKYLYEYLKFYHIVKNVDYFNINTFVSQHTEFYTMDVENREEGLLSIDYEDLKYDDVIIDEAQDFENLELEFFKEYINNRNNNGKFSHIYIFYDKNQLVTDKIIQPVLDNSECKLLLTRNCRNTKQIAKTSYSVLGLNLQHKKFSIEGKETLLHIESVDAIKTLGNIINFYKNDENGYLNDDIVILTLKTEETSILKNVKSILGNDISKIRKNNTIFFTTARKFKGLESKVIIIVDIDEKSFNNDLEKRIFYVACSRAKHRLSLLINADSKKLKKISNSTGIHGFNAAGSISMKTNSKISNI